MNNSVSKGQFEIICKYEVTTSGKNGDSIKRIKQFFGWGNICTFFNCPFSEVIAEELIRLEMNKK